MTECRIKTEQLTAFEQYLREEERSTGTIEKYLRDARAFSTFLAGRPVTKADTLAWKEHLIQSEYAMTTVNSMLAATNRLLEFLGAQACRVKLVRLQRKLFRDGKRELTREEYQRLVDTAQSRGQERLCLLLQAICATGVRVSEVKYLTVEAAREGKAEVTLKGKTRTILIPHKL